MPAIELLYKAALEHPAARTLVINAHADSHLATLNLHSTHLDLWQHFKPEYSAIRNMGLNVAEQFPTCNESYELILMLPSKNRQQTHCWMATAMQKLGENGKLMLACANAHGARSNESALQKLAGNIASSSKSKCRIFSARKTAALNHELCDLWFHYGEPKCLAAHGLVSMPGLFSWDRPDPGSKLLLEELPRLSGSGMDLCSGYGLLSNHLLRSNETIEKMHLVEADRLALDCATRNTAMWKEKIQSHWLDAAADRLPTGLDWIVCNPPFHTGQTRDIDLGQTIIHRACNSLRKGGVLFLVANRQLPYEHVLQSELHNCRVLIQANGFKVIKGIR